MEKKKTNILGSVWSWIKNNPIVVLLTVVSLAMGMFVPNFFSFRNLNALISNTTVRFLIALGVSGCLITKGTDLSAGRQVGLAACLAGTLLQDPGYSARMYQWPEFSIPVALVIVVALGAFIGLINGLIISKLNVPPFIATLGTQTIVYGIALVFTNAQPIGAFKDSYKAFVNGLWFASKEKGGFPGVPYLLAWALIFGVLFWFIYNKTTHGKYMYAIGGNENAAEVSGVNTGRTKILIYVTAGIMYAIAGFLLAPKSGGASSTLGQGYELEAIAGCTIGGVSTTGGIGTVGGVLVGVLVFELLKIVLQFLGVNPFYNNIVQGLVIVVAVAVDIRKYVAKK
ncbi:MAG: beta-methylgalactoside transporter [Oscillospiraceae bacterium]|jgi:methyl-galactoside transport system permease protein|nr:beta-methylgalactoside transporter [Oscillospiraceae bacterium]